MLSAGGEHQDVLEAMKAGATGYLPKSAGLTEFLDAVGRTAAGDTVFTPGLAGRAQPGGTDALRHRAGVGVTG